jgi:toxin ParE1/3/4
VRIKFPVIISPGAESDVMSIRETIARDKPGAAVKWYRGIYKEMRSLRFMPLRFEIIPEAEELDVSYRHHIVGNYRIIYDVKPDRVHILRVIHAARRLTPRFFEESPP